VEPLDSEELFAMLYRVGSTIDDLEVDAVLTEIMALSVSRSRGMQILAAMCQLVGMAMRTQAHLPALQPATGERGQADPPFSRSGETVTDNEGARLAGDAFIAAANLDGNTSLELIAQCVNQTSGIYRQAVIEMAAALRRLPSVRLGG
jgi:hypothetical protein